VRISSSLNIRRPRRVICTAAQAREALDAPALRWRLLALTGSVFKSLFSRSPAMVPASSLPLLFVLNAEISAFADNGTEWNPRGVHVMMLQPAGVNGGLVGYAVVEKFMHKLWNGCHCGVGCRIVEGVCRYSRRKRIMPVLVQKYDFS
jgi:hypothetical protein